MMKQKQKGIHFQISEMIMLNNICFIYVNKSPVKMKKNVLYSKKFMASQRG